jgi:two-component system, OmpR family, catabolic regulation response regulator CreB
MHSRILIIEDEKSIADTIIYILKKDGFETCWVSTGNDGLEIIKNGNVSLVVLDVGLPDGNGFELCKTIRKDFTTPVIFLTARSDEIDRVVGLEIGGDDYMVKPFSPKELAARIRAVLRRTTASIDSTNKSTALFIDEQRAAIAYCGSVLDLSRQEFKILEILLRHPGRVYSREDLINAAWDEPGFCTDRTVDAHIKAIRNKMRAVNPHEDLIETHRGFGYSLKAAK